MSDKYENKLAKAKLVQKQINGKRRGYNTLIGGLDTWEWTESEEVENEESSDSS